MSDTDQSKEIAAAILAAAEFSKYVGSADGDNGPWLKNCFRSWHQIISEVRTEAVDRVENQ